MKNAFLVLLAVSPLCAQQPSGPPAVLRIFREDIKEGKSAAHERTEAAFMQAIAKANYAPHILGLTNMTGSTQAVFLEGHASFASIEESQATIDTPEFGKLDAADAELRTSQRSMLAVYRPDLSYAADKTNPPKIRFFSIETIRVREGEGQKYVELAKLLVSAAEKSGDNQPVATYQVVSGTPDGTFLLLEPMESLKSLDEEPKRVQALIQAVQNGPQTVREYYETFASDESILYAVDPIMSYVPKEWVTASPDFWGRKPPEAVTKAPAAKPAAKKAAK
jgi:hypothetical protein